MPTSPPSAPPGIAEAIRGGAAWLIDFARRPPCAGEASLLTVFGLACASPFDARAIDSAEGVTSAFVAEHDAAADEGNSLIPLLAARALPAGSRACVELLKLSAGTATGSSVSAWAARQLLPQQADDSEPPLPSWVPLLGDRTFPYVAPPNLIRRIANDVGALTLFGERPPGLSPAFTEDLPEMLRFWVFCCIKDDDLDLLCPLARALTFLGGEKPSDAVGFILDHQHGDGRFSAQELSLAVYARERPEFDIACDAYLPLTVASLWTLTSLA